ncbi:MAG: LysM domain-containing protein [Porticoccaceae bacterium]|jgi:hypothetical protein
MKRIFIALLAAWFQCAVAAGDDIVFRDDPPPRHTVEVGDTLWDISAMFLRDPWRWPELWEANPQIANPHLIYPGDVIALVYVDGKPQLTLARGGAADDGQRSGADGRTVVLRPQIREAAHAEAIPSLPLGILNSFLSRTRVAAEGELDTAPYVLAGYEKRLMSGSGDAFFARGALSPEVDFYGIYRKGDPYIDPDTRELLGLKAEDIGSAQLKSIEGEVATLITTRSAREIRVGDRLLPHEQRRLDPAFYPRAPDTEVQGKLISVEGGVSQVGHLDVVAINRGDRDGIDVGSILGIFKAGERIRDRIAGDEIILPSERAGLLMVFRAYEKMSFGLVVHADRPLAVGDEIGNP